MFFWVNWPQANKWIAMLALSGNKQQQVHLLSNSLYFMHFVIDGRNPSTPWPRQGKQTKRTSQKLEGTIYSLATSHSLSLAPAYQQKINVSRANKIHTCRRRFSSQKCLRSRILWSSYSLSSLGVSSLMMQCMSIDGTSLAALQQGSCNVNP